MRKAVGLTTGLCLLLLPTIGSSGTGTITPEANHADRILFAKEAATVDLRAVDRAVAVAVLALDPKTAPAR